MYYNFLRTFVPCKKYSQQYIICIWRKMSAKSSKQNVRTLVKKIRSSVPTWLDRGEETDTK